MQLSVVKSKPVLYTAAAGAAVLGTVKIYKTIKNKKRK